MSGATTPGPIGKTAGRAGSDGRNRGADTTGPFARGLRRITATALGPYQSAVVRIGFAATYLAFLLRELPHRRELYGPDGPWSWDMARQLIDGNGAFTVLIWSDGSAWFETVYAVTLLAALGLLLGWRTRATSAVFMAGVLSVQNRSVFMGDGGDNVVHIMAIYLVLTRCAQVWSLDARRLSRAAERRKDGRSATPDVAGPVLWALLTAALVYGSATNGLGGTWWLPTLFWALWAGNGLWWVVGRRARHGEARSLLDVIANLAHNAALLVIMVEVCLIYATAGWYKIQGSRWQDGTALYYPLKLDYFTPWPGLSDLLASNGLMVMVLTYGTVIVQVAFPFTLFNRRVKNVLLVVMMCEHAGIAVLLGLPFFSMAMIAADAVFLPTVFLLWLGARAAGGRDLLTNRFRDPREDLPGPRDPDGTGQEQRAGSEGRTFVG